MRFTAQEGHEIDVAGIHFQKANARHVIRALGGTQGEGCEVAGWATLKPEPSNPYDPNAVVIIVEGLKIGYVPAGDAPLYGQWVRAQGGDIQVPVRLTATRTDFINASIYLPTYAQLSSPNEAAPQRPNVARYAHEPPPVPAGPQKSHVAAILLSLFLGTLGIDRFYLGHVGLGITKLLLSWLTFGIWQVIDLVLIICKGTLALKRVNWT